MNPGQRALGVDLQGVGQNGLLLAAPEQDAASRSQPRRQVGQHGRREPQRPQRHEIELPGKGVVRAADCSIETPARQRSGASDRLQERPLTLPRLDQDDVEPRPRRREHEAGEAGAGPHVERHPALRNPGKRQQGLDEVSLHHVGRGAGTDEGQARRPPTQLEVVPVEAGQGLLGEGEPGAFDPGDEAGGKRLFGECGERGRGHRPILAEEVPRDHPFDRRRPPVPPSARDSGFTGNMTVKQHPTEDDRPTAAIGPAALDPFDAGFLVGILVGEGHFGGDGRQPQVTLRMHTDHEALFHWLVERVGGKLYGPYHHGGRSYYQWMARGDFLRSQLVPLLDRHLSETIDGKSIRRYREMKERYGL